MNFLNYEYTFCQPKQGLFKVDHNSFKIITEYGKERNVNLNELLVYLFAEGMINSLKVRENVLKNDIDFIMPLKEIDNILNGFVEDKLLKFQPRKKELHKHYSYNPVKIFKNAISYSTNYEFISLGKLELAVTSKCPFNCTYCSKKQHAQQEELSVTEKKRVIYEAFELGAQTITFTGGEPLHNDVVDETLELIKYSYDLGYKRKVLLTSGYNINNHLHSIVDSHLDEVQISYNMNCKFDDDKIRNQYIERNIKQICSLMNFGVRLGVCCVLTNESINYIDEIIHFCLENKLYSLYFYPVMPVGYAKNAWNEIKMSVSELDEALKKIKIMREKYKDKLYISAPQSFMQDEKPFQICEGGMYMLYITESGDASACACSSNSGLNVRDHSLSWIWKKSRYFDIYRIPKTANSICDSCDEYSLCINSCIYREVLATKNLKFYSDKCELMVGKTVSK